MKKNSLLYVFLIVLFAGLLSACSSGTTAPTPTAVDIAALQTEAVKTVIANFTQTAAALPTQTPEPSATQALIPTETATLEVTATQAQCDDSIFVSDASVPDNTQMTAGQDFVKSWKIRNTGTCTWTTGYQIIWSHGEKMGGLPTPLSAEVLPGSEIEISVNMKAPTATGTYGGYWRLTSNNGIAFGQVVSVIIIVP